MNPSPTSTPMRQVFLTFLSLLGLVAATQGQTIILDDFSGTTGQVMGGSSWNTNATLADGLLTVDGTAKDDNGWAWNGSAIDATGMTYIQITAQRDSGHDAGAFFSIQLEDGDLDTKIFSVSTSSFLVGSMSTVEIAIDSWGDVNFDEIQGWSIGGGAEPALLSFHMTFNTLALSATSSAIPEPATYAAWSGLLGLVAVAAFRIRSRRRQA